MKGRARIRTSRIVIAALCYAAGVLLLPLPLQAQKKVAPQLQAPVLDKAGVRRIPGLDDGPNRVMPTDTDLFKVPSVNNDNLDLSPTTRPTAASARPTGPVPSAKHKRPVNTAPRANSAMFNPFDRELPAQFEPTPIALTGVPGLTMRPRLGQLDRSATEDLLSFGVPNITGNPFTLGAQNIQSSFTLDWDDPKSRAAPAVMPITRVPIVPRQMDASGLAIASISWLDPGHEIDWSSVPALAGTAVLDPDNSLAIGTTLFIPASSKESGWRALAIAMLSRDEFTHANIHKGMKPSYSINLFTPGIAPEESASTMQDVRNIWYSQSFTTPIIPPIGQFQVVPAPLTLSNVSEATLPGYHAKPGLYDDDASGLAASGAYDLREESSEAIASTAHASTADLFNAFYLRDPRAINGNDDPAAPFPTSRVALTDASMKNAIRFELNIPRGQSSSQWTGGFATQVLWIINENYRLFTTGKAGGMKPSGPTRFGILAAGLTMALLCRRKRSISPIPAY